MPALPMTRYRSRRGIVGDFLPDDLINRLSPLRVTFGQEFANSLGIGVVPNRFNPYWSFFASDNGSSCVKSPMAGDDEAILSDYKRFSNAMLANRAS